MHRRRQFIGVDQKLCKDQTDVDGLVCRHENRRKVKADQVVPFSTHRLLHVTAGVFEIAPRIDGLDLVTSVKTAVDERDGR
jgi:hypothetical protein